MAIKLIIKMNFTLMWFKLLFKNDIKVKFYSAHTSSKFIRINDRKIN